MMEQFLTWEMIADYVTFVGIVFEIVAVTKSLPIIKYIPTRVWSLIISFGLLCAINLHAGTFERWDLLIYFINSIVISLSANGLADANGGGKK